jgi:multicomponent Na+:H+ antiporter subunit D
MNLSCCLPALILMSSLIPGLIIFFLPEDRYRLRTLLNMAGATLKLVLVAILVWGVYHEETFRTQLPLLPGMDLVLHADALSVLFTTLSSVLWFLTTLYAIAYLEHSPQPRSRFFGFFSLCVSATIGISMAGNLITFLIFYEALTLSTYPLVIHRGSPESMRAGGVYLAYTLIGGAALMAGVAWLVTLAGSVDFVEGGSLAGLPETAGTQLRFIFVLLIAGLGVKAALVPLHGWLPAAMVAPAPVSALLHAVAVVKAGAFGIVRVIYDVYGIAAARHLGLLEPLAWMAAATVVYGSLRALRQDELKKRLAYSTVSQVSYIALGCAVGGPLGTLGGIVHLAHQGLMKITLFFCAGNIAETLGFHRVSEMRGVGRRMPLTMAAFTLGALGMIGVPPLAGFISKWYLASGCLTTGQGWVILVLAASSALNAAYFLPVLYTAWFEEAEEPWSEEASLGWREAHWMLLAPPLITAGLAVAAGLLANAPFSPLEWSRLIVFREYRQ